MMTIDDEGARGVWPMMTSSQKPQYKFLVDFRDFSENFSKVFLGVIHKGRPQPRGEGGSAKSGQGRTVGGRGGQRQKRTSAFSCNISNFLCQISLSKAKNIS